MSLEIKDDLLAPKSKISFKYKGKDPFSIAAMSGNLFKETLNVSASKVYENDVRWDVTDDPREFFLITRAHKPLDKWSEIIIKIVMHGYQSIKDKTGNVKVDISGTLETEFEYGNFFTRAMVWFYYQLFYNEQRRRYMEEGKDYMFKIRDAFYEQLNIHPEERRYV